MPGRIWDLRVLALISKGTSMSHLWVLDKRYPPAVLIVMGLLVVRKFIIGAVSFKNMPVYPVYSSPVSLFPTTFLFGGSTISCFLQIK